MRGAFLERERVVAWGTSQVISDWHYVSCLRTTKPEEKEPVFWDNIPQVFNIIIGELSFAYYKEIMEK